jgi:hypothetical protein
MTIKERLHKLVDELPEQGAERLLQAAERELEDIDEWGNLSKLHEVAFGETMQRLAEEERNAGHDPW